MTQHTCLWWEAAQKTAPRLNKFLPSKTDVVVVGGGYTGTSAALQLAKGGAYVTLLEAKSIGFEASSRNGGQALSCLHHTLTETVKQHGRELAAEMFRAAVRAADTVERIITEEDLECDFVRCGSIEAASKANHFERFKREQESLHESANFEVILLPRGEVRSELGTNAYHGLMINPRSGSLQPAKFVRGMAMAAERAGADIHEGTRVFSIQRLSSLAYDGTRFLVRTERGDIAAKEVMIAAKAWTGRILPQFRRRVFPAESYVIATEPLSDELASKLIPNKRVVYDTRRTLAYYRLSPDQRMVWGGEIAMAGASPKTNINILRRGMTRIFPELANTKLDYHWEGTLALTMDENTHAGQSDGIWYSMAYVGHGVTLATYLGQQLANAILGKPSNNPFANLKIPTAPPYEGKAWFVNIGKVWYRFLDMLS